MRCAFPRRHSPANRRRGVRGTRLYASACPACACAPACIFHIRRAAPEDSTTERRLSPGRPEPNTLPSRRQITSSPSFSPLGLPRDPANLWRARRPIMRLMAQVRQSIRCRQADNVYLITTRPSVLLSLLPSLQRPPQGSSAARPSERSSDTRVALCLASLVVLSPLPHWPSAASIRADMPTC